MNGEKHRADGRGGAYEVCAEYGQIIIGFDDLRSKPDDRAQPTAACQSITMSPGRIQPTREPS